MISHTAYKLVHLVGIFLLMVSLGGLILHRINGGTRVQPWRRPVALTHGFGMFFVLLGGFGMMARLGIQWPWPAWLLVKQAIWLAFGLLIAVILRRPPGTSKPIWLGIVFLGGFAAYLALYKPF